MCRLSSYSAGDYAGRVMRYGPIYEVRAGSARRVSASAIDVEVRLASDGEWIPFTASQDDDEAYGRLLCAAVLRGEHGTIAPTPAPMPAPPAPAPTLAERLRTALTESGDDIAALRAALLRALASA